MPAETHSHATPFGADEVRSLVIERLAELTPRDPTTISLQATLRGDLELDDLGLLDFAEALEADFGEREVGLAFDDDELQELVTVRDAVEYVLACLGIETR
jgi:acyl carrier protein